MGSRDDRRVCEYPKFLLRFESTKVSQLSLNLATYYDSSDHTNSTSNAISNTTNRFRWTFDKCLTMKTKTAC